MIEVELWIVVDAEGDYVVSKDGEAEAYELHAEDVGGDGPKRCVKVTLEVPAPKAIEMRGRVPEESNEGAALTVN